MGNDVDAVMSLDLTSGAIKWLHKLQGFDAWTTACIGLPTACPSPNGPDYDFGQGAMLIPTKAGDIVAAGKGWDHVGSERGTTGAIVWKTLVGPRQARSEASSGARQQIGKRIYFAVANLNFGPSAHYTMVNPPKGTPATSDAGSWGAVDPVTGAIIWQTADPNGSIDIGPVSVANGVVYAGSMGGLFFPPFANTEPTMFALDAKDGTQLWSYVSGGSVNAGPAIVDGTVYWGSGYTHLGFGGGNNKLFAFGR